MHSEYKSSNSISQVLIALVATILIGSVALVGTVGPANAAPTAVIATA